MRANETTADDSQDVRQDGVEEGTKKKKKRADDRWAAADQQCKSARSGSRGSQGLDPDSTCSTNTHRLRFIAGRFATACCCLEAVAVVVAREVRGKREDRGKGSTAREFRAAQLLHWRELFVFLCLSVSLFSRLHNPSLDISPSPLPPRSPAPSAFLTPPPY